MNASQDIRSSISTRSSHTLCTLWVRTIPRLSWTKPQRTGTTRTLSTIYLRRNADGWFTTSKIGEQVLVGTKSYLSLGRFSCSRQPFSTKIPGINWLYRAQVARCSEYEQEDALFFVERSPQKKFHQCFSWHKRSGPGRRLPRDRYVPNTVLVSYVANTIMKSRPGADFSGIR